jgi:hypothetical protein
MNMPSSCAAGSPGQYVVVGVENLAENGFTQKEIASLVRLREWYQTGGSDRVSIVRHWEFLKFLVERGKIQA